MHFFFFRCIFWGCGELKAYGSFRARDQISASAATYAESLTCWPQWELPKCARYIWNYNNSIHKHLERMYFGSMESYGWKIPFIVLHHLSWNRLKTEDKWTCFFQGEMQSSCRIMLPHGDPAIKHMKHRTGCFNSQWIQPNTFLLASKSIPNPQVNSGNTYMLWICTSVPLSSHVPSLY